jgi:hypothetical protein
VNTTNEYKQEQNITPRKKEKGRKKRKRKKEEGEEGGERN